MSRKFTTQEFIQKAKAVHGDKYDYSKVFYETMHTKVLIGCPQHYYWYTKPCDHINSASGCPECGKEATGQKCRLDKEEVLARIKTIHGDKYEYDLSFEYKGKDTKIGVKCHEHGWFFPSIHNHTVGKSECPECAISGFKYSGKGILYILNCGDITKVGITNISAESRCRAVSKSYGERFAVLWHKELETAELACDVETELLRILRSKYLQPQDKFQGHSECFYDVDLQDLLEITDNLIQEHADAQQQ